MTLLADTVRAAPTAGNLAHLVTLEEDGRPQLSVVWVGVDGDDIVSGHLGNRRTPDNVRRHPRVALSRWRARASSHPGSPATGGPPPGPG